MQEVWVFNGVGGAFPSGVFDAVDVAELWIAKYQLSGTLTEYPIGVGVFDWAIDRGLFKPKVGRVYDANFIGQFTSASMRHFHYEDGVKTM